MTALMHHLLATPTWVALLVVFAVPGLEASIFLGFVVPGETALVLGGVLSSQGHAPLIGVLVAGIAGAIVGDSVGYWVGRRWGRRVLDSALGRFVKPEHLDRAEHLLRDRGGWTVLVGRFTAALRALVPGLAGMGRMPYRRFVGFNVLGGTLWGAAMVLVGYLAGSSWRLIAHDVSTGGLVLTGVVIAVVVVVLLIRRRRHRYVEQVSEHSSDDSAR